MGHTFQAANTSILINLVQLQIWLDGNCTLGTNSSTCCTLNARVEFGRLFLNLPCELPHVLLGIDDRKTQHSTIRWRLDYQRIPVLIGSGL